MSEFGEIHHEDGIVSLSGFFDHIHGYGDERKTVEITLYEATVLVRHWLDQVAVDEKASEDCGGGYNHRGNNYAVGRVKNIEESGLLSRDQILEINEEVHEDVQKRYGDDDESEGEMASSEDEDPAEPDIDF